MFLCGLPRFLVQAGCPLVSNAFGQDRGCEDAAQENPEAPRRSFAFEKNRCIKELAPEGRTRQALTVCAQIYSTVHLLVCPRLAGVALPSQ